MPGLIDAHVHTPPKLAIGNQRLFALLYLAYGVTSVRDMGQTDDSIAALQADDQTRHFRKDFAHPRRNRRRSR